MGTITRLYRIRPHSSNNFRSIKKPKTSRYPSLKGVDPKFRRNHRHALHGNMKAMVRSGPEYIPLEQMNTSMTINATAPWLLSLYIAVAEEQGADVSKLQGTVQNDLIKEYLSRGTYICPPKPSLRMIGDVAEYCYTNVPKWNPMNVCSYHLQEAGATPEQELAFALATGIDRKSVV